jgi:hypothetical protein
LWEALEKEFEVTCLVERTIHQGRLDHCTLPAQALVRYAVEGLESMLIEGWVHGFVREGVSFLNTAFVDSIGRA